MDSMLSANDAAACPPAAAWCAQGAAGSSQLPFRDMPAALRSYPAGPQGLAHSSMCRRPAREAGALNQAALAARTPPQVTRS